MNYAMMSLDELKRYAEPVTELEKAVFNFLTDEYIHVDDFDCNRCDSMESELDMVVDERNTLEVEVHDLEKKVEELTKRLESK